MFEGAEVAGMEANQDSHDLAQGQSGCPLTAFFVGQHNLTQFGLKGLTEIVDIYKSSGKIHYWASLLLVF